MAVNTVLKEVNILQKNQSLTFLVEQLYHKLNIDKNEEGASRLKRKLTDGIRVLETTANEAATLKEKNLEQQQQIQDLTTTEADEIGILREENNKLTDEIEQLKQNAKAMEVLKEENTNLINETKRLRIEADEAHSKCVTLQTELSRFTKYESVKEVKHVEEQLETLNENLNSIIEELKNNVTGLHRHECFSAIGRQMVQYRKYKADLSHSGVEFNSEPDFSSMIGSYKNACEVNDAKIKDIFKLLYEASKATKHKTDKFALIIHDTLQDMEHFAEEQSNVLTKLEKDAVEDSMDIEKQLYSVVLETIKKRVAFFDLLQINTNHAESEAKNLKMDYQHLIECFRDSTESPENNVSYYDIWKIEDGENDLLSLFELNELD